MTKEKNNIMIKEKIIEYPFLAEIRKKYNDQKIVLCHGAFDLIHPGHIFHFEEARNLGDILVVTITADEYIKKKREVSFNQEIRSRQLASLEIVNYVSIIPEPSAVTAIKYLTPDYYVKGNEYQNLLLDKTKNIFREKDIVEEYGGKIHFTSGQTFSSTKIGHFLHSASEADQNRPFLKYHKVRFKDISEYKFSLEEIKQFIFEASTKRVCVLGETIIDEWIYMKLHSISQKSRCITGEKISQRSQIGGAGIIAKHCAKFVKEVDLFTNCFPYNEDSNLKIFPLSDGILKKTRFVNIENNVSLFESKEIKINNVNNTILPDFDNYDLVIIADFGHRLLDANLMNIKLDKRKKSIAAIMAQSNSSNYGFNLPIKYKNADYFSMNRIEAELCLHMQGLNINQIIEGITEIFHKKIYSITDGNNGAYYIRNSKSYYLPSLCESTIDTIGCGDAYLVFSSIATICDMRPEFITLAGNIGAAGMAQKICNESPIDELEFMTIAKIVI